MYQPIEGITDLAEVDGQTIEYWDGGGGLTDPHLYVGGQGIVLPGLICRKVDDPQPEPMERIAAALERIADKLDALTSGAGNLKVERP